MESEKKIYPGILLRVKSMFIDYFIFVLLIFIVSFFFKNLDHISDSLRIGAFIFVFFLFEPLMVSFFGGSIGHQMNGIRVKKIGNHQKNIPLLLALFRFFLKVFLGWLSLVTINKNTHSQAIHDKAVNSVVIFKEKKY